MAKRRRADRRSPRRYPRTARVNEVLREVVADELRRLNDEPLELVTVTGVDADPDLRHATVWLSSLDEALEAALAVQRVRLQGAIAAQLRLKRTPELAFRPDPGIASGARVEEILRGLRKEQDDG